MEQAIHGIEASTQTKHTQQIKKLNKKKPAVQSAPKKRGRPKKLDALKKRHKRGRPKKSQPSFPGSEPKNPPPKIPHESKD